MPISSPVEIIRRRVNIQFNASTMSSWLKSEKDIQDVLNAVSFVFPPGERFFIQSVRHYHDRIQDPVLKEQVSAFIFQEAMHSKEHGRANEKLAGTFPKGPEIEAIVARSLARVTRYAPRSSQLAFTCALEHFTAILSNNLLKWQKEFVANSDPALAAMWLWHAVEEAEHKAVCFDVYQKVCGKGVISYLHRVAAMMAATILFLYSISSSLRALKKGAPHSQDGATSAQRALEGSEPVKRQSFSQIVLGIVPLKLYFDYYRPTFHPWDNDDRALIDEWKQRYRDYEAIREIAKPI